MRISEVRVERQPSPVALMQSDEAGVVICMCLAGPEEHVANLVSGSRGRSSHKLRLNRVPQSEDLLSGEVRSCCRNHSLCAAWFAEGAAGQYRFEERLVRYRCRRGLGSQCCCYCVIRLSERLPAEAHEEGRLIELHG